ncbi:ABC transporter, substrate-binding domain protein, partial [Bordetella hinzii CA90 BAL1384]
MLIGKKHFLTVGALALAMAAGSAMAQQKSVAVTAIVEHPALDSVRDGVKDALKQAGFDAN